MSNFSYEQLKSKNGLKIRESYLQKNFPSEYRNVKEFINKYALTEISFQESLFLFLHSETHPRKCKTCKINRVHFESFNVGYFEYCSPKCSSQNETVALKKQNTLQNKYGVSNVFQSEEVKRKSKETVEKKYGVSNVFQSEEVKRKSKETVKKKYGVSNISQTNKNRERARQQIKNVTPSYSKVRQKFQEKYSNVNFIEHTGKIIKYYCQCEKRSECEMDRSSFAFRYSNNINLCTKCNPISNSSSYAETEIFDYIQTITNQEIVLKDRNIIQPYELDIYIPSLKIAIEYNGLYWHREEKVGKMYHLDKTKKCAELGIQLIHVFEDEWLEKREIVKSILFSKINKNNNKIFARKCQILELSKAEAYAFYEKNHILGGIYCNFNFGLFFNNELVAAIGIGANRKIMNQKNEDGKYELIRYCNKISTTVVGGGSKLFQFFIKKFSPKQVITYANRRYFTGDFYQHLGFTFIGETQPNYYYVNRKSTQKRENRFKYRKDILLKNGEDKNLSEFQIMEKNGFFRIYDCGNFKYLWVF